METMGPKAVKNIVSGIGIGLILKKITINFKVSTSFYVRDLIFLTLDSSIAASCLS